MLFSGGKNPPSSSQWSLTGAAQHQLEGSGTKSESEMCGESKIVSRACGSVRNDLFTLQAKVTRIIIEAPKCFQEKYNAERNPWHQLYNISGKLQKLQRLIKEKPSSVDHGKVEDLERELERVLGELSDSNSTRSPGLR